MSLHKQLFSHCFAVLTVRCAAIGLLVGVFNVGAQYAYANQCELNVTGYVRSADGVPFQDTTHITFGLGNQEIVTDLGNHRFVYREDSSSVFQISPLSVNTPHSVVYKPADAWVLRQ